MNADVPILTWVIVLLGSVLFSALGVIVPATLRSLKESRSHHTVKMIHEFLAKHQLVYVPFFASFFAARQSKGDTPIIILVFGLTLLFYFFSVLSLVEQDRKATRLHKCNAIGCTKPMLMKGAFSLFGCTFPFSVILFIGAILLIALLPG